MEIDDLLLEEIKTEVGAFGKGVEELKRSYNAKQDALQGRLDAMERKFNRGRLGGGAPDRGGDPTPEHKALGTFVRSEGHGDLTELKSMSVGSDPDGGYLVLPQMSPTIREVVRDQSVMSRLARVQTLTTGDSWEEPAEREDEWGAEDVGENEARPETDSGDIGMVRTPLHEVYANVKVTQKLLDMASIDVGAWIERKIGDHFGRKEGYNYLLGNGVKRARGLLTYATDAAADFTRAADKFQHVLSGAANAVTGDCLRDLYWKARAPFRANGTWLMASDTANKIDKLKTGDGAYIWRDSSSAGVPPTLLGRPVEFDEGMPSVADGNLSIAFGDFKRGYLIVERPGLRFLRDPYTAKPHVMIYAIKRSGGAAADFHAIKFLKIGAS